MRIPLDRYQILGVTEDNLSDLEGAYRDRLLQLPRREYSDAAIESRKKLIAAAYEVLSDPQQRAEYDAERAVAGAKNRHHSDRQAGDANAEPSPFDRRPELDIPAEHFLGGLLILFELGEFEEIVSICMPYLGNNGRSSNSGNLHPPSSASSGNLRSTPFGAMPLSKVKQTANGTIYVPLKPDIVLAIVSSLWELGEREWRDANYEGAASDFEAAKKILIQEDLFPQIQGELERRLDRLRPYRIQSLVSLPLDRHEQRRQGIQFLEELLESACTNEVKCQERFALNSESTIPFIHETLPHLTAAEQRNLFSQIARDAQQVGSSSLNVMQLACTYLHVHALIAQGFAYRNPQLIYTAQQILLYRLSPRIDVTIEQAICSLLLGQTEEAAQMLATASESAALVVIRQQSQGLPNLLRGLCWYIESWLKNEAFPCFRDLVDSDPSLNAYFNDRDVQDFADRLPAADRYVGSWATEVPKLHDVPPSGDLSGSLQPSHPSQPDRPILTVQATGRRTNGIDLSGQPSAARLNVGNITPAVRVETTPPPPPPAAIPVDVGTEEPTTGSPSPTLATGGSADPTSGSNVIHFEQERQRRRSSMPTVRTLDGQFEQTYPQEHLPAKMVPPASSQLVPAAKSGMLTKQGTTGTIVRPRRNRRRKPNIPRILLVGTGGVTCLWGAVWLAGTAVRNISALDRPVRTVATMSATPIPAASPIAKSGITTASPSVPTNSKTLAVGLLSTDTATQIVKTWLSAKSRSLSKDYQTDRLKDILAEPALSTVLARSKDAKASGTYWLYEHPQVKIDSIAQANPVANSAKVLARVTEHAKHYQGDRLNSDRSYSRELVVQYDLVRQANGWYIKGMDVVK